MTIRCLVVDDEAYAAKIITDYIGKVSFLSLAGTTTSGIRALELVQQGDIDLVFLDIQMPELTGIQFLRLLGNRCKVILTTAYPEYALDGYEYDVVDYLVKPIAFERFLKASQKALQLLQTGKEQKDTVENPAVLQETGKGSGDPGFIFIKGETKNKFFKISLSDILYVEGMKNYISIFTPDQKLVTYQALRDFETQLPTPPFYRVHKSFIVSIDKIKMVDGNTIYIRDKQIPIGDTFKEGFYKIIREAT